MRLALKLKTIHRVLEFNQSQWLKPYIEFNTKKGTKVKTLKYWFGFQRGQFYLMGRRCPLALVGHPYSDGVTVKIPYGVDVLLHRPALHSIFSNWVG